MKNNTMNPPIEETAVVTATPYTDVAFAKEAQKRNKSIKTELAKIDNSFEKIAFNLYWFSHNKAYEQLGYKTFADLASKEFNIAKSTAYNFINVVERFAERDEKGEVVERIREEYKDFKSSKLIALLDVPMDEQLSEFDADMSVRDIKKKVKELTKEDVEENAEDAAEDDSIIDTTAEEIHRQEVISFSDIAAYNDYLDKMTDLIEKNLKSKAFKDGKHKIEVSVVWTE
uniref:hypothetical protein n=1 Tax=Acetatifactor sp. TaxID=1872090 RepID=UPI004057B76A